MTALLVAAGQGHTASVEALLAAGAQDVQDEAGLTALDLARDRGKTETVKVLQERRP